MINFIKTLIKKRIAKSITKEYPTRIDDFDLGVFGQIKFANWENPLVENKVIHESHVSFFRKFVQEGDMAIDIGANVGQMTIPLGVALGTSGLCLAFDPNPIVFKILKINVGLNPDKSNVHAFNNAITDVEEEFFYHSSEASFNNGGISTVAKSRHGKYVLPQKIKGIPLESFLESNYPEYKTKLKLIKIDTEGYDKEIAKSIGSILKKYRPALISECFGKMPAENKFEYFEFLTNLGYSLYYFEDFEENAEIIPITKKEDMLKWKHFDFYAIYN